MEIVFLIMFFTWILFIAIITLLFGEPQPKNKKKRKRRIKIMKATLKLENGKTIDMELTKEQEELINQSDKKRTGYERVEWGDTYYSSNNGDLSECDGNIYTADDINDYVDNSRYDNADYYNDKILAKNITRADTLMRRLRRFAVENGGSFSRDEWANDTINKYEVHFDYEYNALNIVSSCSTIKYIFDIYFRSKEIAQKAIDTFKDELMWYYTEYDDMLR